MEQQITPGLEFSNKWMPYHKFRVVEVRESADRLTVHIENKVDASSYWAENDWILSHTKIAFERGEYFVALTASQPPAVKGAVWVYTAKSLPKDGTIVLCEYKSGDLSHMEYLEGNKDWWIRNVHRWLDEQSGNTGELPAKGPQWVKGAPTHREQTYAEFLSPLDNQYKGIVYPVPDTEYWWAIGKDFRFTVHESKIIAHLDESPTAAGDGKEDAVAFNDWIRENEYQYDAKMKCWIEYDANTLKDHYLCDTTAQLYDIFKNRNKQQ